MTNQTKPKRAYGMKDAKRRFPYLEEKTWQACKRIGHGNASEGIRKAVKAYGQG